MSQDEYKGLQKESRKLSRMFDQLAKPRFSSAEFVEAFEKTLKKLPAGSAIAEAVDELRARAEKLLEVERRDRIEAFRRVETDFVKRVREHGEPVQELDSSWRVGSLEMQVDRGRGRVRLAYNHEPVTPWKPVKDADDLDSLRDKALKALDKAALTDEEVIAVVTAAYARAREEQPTSAGDPRLVPILDLLREMRIELVRRDLSGSKPGKKLSSAEFPMWALLYNLDRYRALGAQVPADERVAFQTGSQQEQAKGMGVSLNGLRADQDYKVYCYALRNS